MSNSVVSFKKGPKEKTWGKEKKTNAVASFYVFRERVSSFSLDFREIRPSKFVRTRSKVALCIEAYA